MGVFIFQIQNPEALSEPKRRLERLVEFADAAAALEIDDAQFDAKQSWMNLRVESALALHDFWEPIRQGLDQDLAQAMIVLASVDGDFDDYLLAHHFDPSQATDELPGAPKARGPRH